MEHDKRSRAKLKKQQPAGISAATKTAPSPARSRRTFMESTKLASTRVRACLADNSNRTVKCDVLPGTAWSIKGNSCPYIYILHKSSLDKFKCNKKHIYIYTRTKVSNETLRFASAVRVLISEVAKSALMATGATTNKRRSDTTQTDSTSTVLHKKVAFLGLLLFLLFLLLLVLLVLLIFLIFFSGLGFLRIYRGGNRGGGLKNKSLVQIIRAPVHSAKNPSHSQGLLSQRVPGPPALP
jgi:hypothetical protein